MPRSYNVTVKPAVWNVFAMSVESVLMWYFLLEYAFEHTVLFKKLDLVFYCTFYCVMLPSGVINDDISAGARICCEKLQ